MLVLIGAAWMAMGCNGTGGAPPPPGSPGQMNDPCFGRDGGVQCTGDTAHFCNDQGRSLRQENCAETDRRCQPEQGCVACRRGEVDCQDNRPRFCNMDGSAFVEGEPCDAAAGEYCSPTGCVNLCEQAAESESYIGCEYWPTTVFNPAIRTEFDFAVGIANPQLVPAEVQVSLGTTEVASVVVAPGELETIRLPWVIDLKDGGAVPEGVAPEDVPPPMSFLERAGAYRLSSNVPVSVYQFNPLEYRIDQDCRFEPSPEADDGQCFAYTNDASILLPTHTFRNNYIVMSRPTQALELTWDDGFRAFDSTPGFVSIVGTEDGTEVEVVARSRVAGNLAQEIPDMMPDDTHRFTINRGDVLQLLSGMPIDRCPDTFATNRARDARVKYCILDETYDLTGSEIRTSAPVGVFAGHGCTFVPFDRWACDHLEEMLFPVEAWGESVLVSVSHALRGEPDVVRIVSAHDANRITFDPPIQDPQLLNRGEYFEFEAEDHVRITGTAALSVMQFLVGQDYHGPESTPRGSVGDPSMSLAIPEEQYRREYTILAPESYVQNWVNITAPTGTRVFIDDTRVSNWTQVGDTGMSVARTRISGGVHRIHSNVAFGVVVYGFGAYTSYMYPGGLDLSVIAPPI